MIQQVQLQVQVEVQNTKLNESYLYELDQFDDNNMKNHFSKFKYRVSDDRALNLILRLRLKFQLQKSS